MIIDTDDLSVALVNAINASRDGKVITMSWGGNITPNYYMFLFGMSEYVARRFGWRFCLDSDYNMKRSRWGRLFGD